MLRLRHRAGNAGPLECHVGSAIRRTNRGCGAERSLRDGLGREGAAPQVLLVEQVRTTVLAKSKNESLIADQGSGAVPPRSRSRSSARRREREPIRDTFLEVARRCGLMLCVLPRSRRPQVHCARNRRLIRVCPDGCLLFLQARIAGSSLHAGGLHDGPAPPRISTAAQGQRAATCRTARWPCRAKTRQMLQ